MNQDTATISSLHSIHGMLCRFLTGIMFVASDPGANWFIMFKSLQRCHGIELFKNRLRCITQIFLHVMSQVWMFSIALNCFTHQEMSYVDVSSRVNIESSIEHLHLQVVHLFDKHTTSNLFIILEKFLDALLPNWRNHIIGVSTYGDHTMTGRFRGLAIHIDKVEMQPSG